MAEARHRPCAWRSRVEPLIQADGQRFSRTQVIRIRFARGNVVKG